MEKMDTTNISTSISTADDKAMTTTVTSARLLSPKQMRARRELSANLVNAIATLTGSTKRP